MDLGGDVTSNGVSKMFFTIVAAFAEFELSRLVERICDVKASEREKGRYLGGHRPYGFQVTGDGELIEDEVEQNLINHIVSLRDRGNSLRVISDAVSVGSNKISHVTIKRILVDKNAYS